MKISYQISEKVSDFISRNQLIEQGDTVIIGVSGGADSMCLLFLLLELSEKIGYAVKVIHVEHGIRGQASLDDATYVSSMCGSLGVDCKVVHIDAVGYAEDNSLTLEEAARLLRYRAFSEYQAELATSVLGDKSALGDNSALGEKCGGDVDCGQGPCVKIAVAHHVDDQAETIIFQMLRGSGLKGMSGMGPRRENIIRPLLCLSREEILTYLSEKGVSYRTDESNNDNSYSRNYLRNEIMPKLINLQPKAIEHISEMADEFREVEEFLINQARPIYEKCVTKEEAGLSLNVKELMREFSCEGSAEGEKVHSKNPGLNKVLVKTVIRMAVSECIPSRKDVGRTHFDAILGLIDKGSGKKVELPKGVTVKKQGDHLIFSLPDKEILSNDYLEGSDGCEIAGDGEYDLAHGKCARVKKYKRSKDFVIPADNYTKCFDYDMITDGLKLRTAEPGDYLIVDKAGHRKLLKDYLVNEKVEATLRDKVILLTDGSHVLWVIGLRISEYYKITDETENIIEISVTGGFPWEKK